MGSGRFSFAPNGSEMKQFGFNLAETLKFSNFQTEYAAILRVGIPSSALKAFNVTHGQIDPINFRSGVLTIENQATLNIFNSIIKSVEHAF